MKVLLVRHAVAEDRQEFSRTGKKDTERPLTRDGREKMRRVAQAAALALPELDVIVTSPLVRAMQTAKILGAVYSDAEIVRLDSLSPNGVHQATLDWLGKHSNLRCAALVGHEPDLSMLLATLVSGNALPFFEFKKGGMALVSFSGKPSAGSARLEWALTPSVARQIRAARG